MLPPLEQLLVMGGDDRITLDASGLNTYGYGVVPQPEEMGFGSSTASTISTSGWQAAKQCYERLHHGLKAHSPESLYTAELEQLRHQFLSVNKLKNATAIAAIFAASGTDIHLYAATLLHGTHHKPLLTITVEASETGSGVAKAIAGQHFSTLSSGGDAVVAGDALDSAIKAYHISVAARDSAGQLRGDDDIATDIDRIVACAVATDQHVLLVIADVSKTGLISPGLEYALHLRHSWPNHVTIMIDACQFRLSHETLQAYLDHEFLVALTGSKFFGGPAFSGLLLCPPELSRTWQNQPVPHSLCGYARRAEWPHHWCASRTLRSTANFGLLMRWTAALVEMENFHAVPATHIEQSMSRFRKSMMEHFETSAALELVASRPLNRTAVGIQPGWDNIPTIFPFLLRDGAGGYFSPHSTKIIYHQLADEGIHIGQPVPCGLRFGQPVSALRLCFSARLAVETSYSEQSLQVIIGQGIALLNRVSMLQQMLPHKLYA